MALCKQSSLGDLPDELIIRILSWLPILDLFHVYEVPNQRLKNLAVDKGLLRNITFAGFYNQDHATIAKVIKSFGRSDCTTSVSLENCYQLKLSQVVRSLASLSGLQVLDLTSVPTSPINLAKLLNGLTSLESLAVIGPNSRLVDEDQNPVHPFSEQTMETLKRLKHLKIIVGYDGMKTNILSCCHNVETLRLDFIKSHIHDFSYCVCEMILDEELDRLEKLQVLYSPANGMKRAGITCWARIVKHFQNFEPITWKSKQGICFQSYNIVEAGFSEHGSYEPSWTALVRDYSDEEGLSETPASPFFELPSEDDVKFADNDLDKHDMLVSDVKAVKAMRLCCVPPEEKYTHLEEFDVFCLSDHFFDGAETSQNHPPPRENEDERRGMFEGLLQFMKQAPNLWRFSLTVPSTKVTIRKFLADLSEKCKQLQSFSLSFPTHWPHLQLSPHLSAALPNMKLLQDLRIESSHFQFNPQFVWALQQCPVLTRLCILTKSGSCSSCQNLPAVFNSCKSLIFVCLDGFTHDPCSNKQAQKVKTAIKNSYCTLCQHVIAFILLWGDLTIRALSVQHAMQENRKRSRYLASRPALFVALSLEGKHSIPEVHFAEMVGNKWGQRH